jgi:hypothetical protein
MIKIGIYEYDCVGDFQPDSTTWARLDGKYFHIGKDGKPLYEERYYYVQNFELNGIAKVILDEELYINKTGKNVNEFILKKCQDIAHDIHKNQKRRDGTPYINHPMRVSDMVDGIIEKCVAVLHDVLENSTYTAEDLLTSGIPKRIVEVVQILTHNNNETYDEYIERVNRDNSAKYVKIADIVHNLSDRPTDDQIKKYFNALIELTERDEYN